MKRIKQLICKIRIATMAGKYRPPCVPIECNIPMPAVKLPKQDAECEPEKYPVYSSPKKLATITFTEENGLQITVDSKANVSVTVRRGGESK